MCESSKYVPHIVATAAKTSAVDPLASVLTEELARRKERRAELARGTEQHPSDEIMNAQTELDKELAVLERGIAAARHESGKARG